MIWCDFCGGELHIICIGMTEEELQTISEDVQFECDKCENENITVDDLFLKIENKKDRCDAELEHLKNEHLDLDLKLQLAKTSSLEKMGPVQTKLHEVIKNVYSVEQKAYHGKLFIGNHALKILKNPLAMVDVIKDSDNYQNFLHLFDLFSKIIHIIFKSEILTNADLENLTSNCDDMSIFFPKAFPNVNIKPKFHILICHIPTFAKKWHSVGLFTEQGIESTHRAMNQELRSLLSVKCVNTKFKLAIERHTLQFTSDRSKIQPTFQRKCRDCNGFYKYNYKDKLVNCQLCLKPKFN